MEKIVSIKKGAVTYALIFRNVSAAGGARFLTEPGEELQAGVMERSTGYIVQPHRHTRGAKNIEGLSEFLYIERGKIRVTVYDDLWKLLGQETLSTGDFLLFYRGGHGIEVLETCRMIEVKQGPYVGTATVKNFQSAS